MAERGAAVAVTALALYLHGVFFWKAGGLWRDEASGLAVALQPTLGEVWRHGEFDSFPQGWHCVLRLWSACGLGESDGGWRVLGLAIGAGVCGAMWWNARRFGGGVPLLGLALLEINDVVVVYGDSVRGLGLGAALGLLTMGTMWGVARAPSVGRWFWAFAVALASVHVMFQNVVVVLATSVGGAVVCLRRQRWSGVAAIGVIGLVCAGSMLAYVGAFERAAEWNVVRKVAVDFRDVWGSFGWTTRSMGVGTTWLWVGACLLVMAGLIVAELPGLGGKLEECQRDGALFCGVTLAVGVAGHVVLLKVVSYPIQPWYFIVGMVLIAGCLEGSLGVLASSSRGKMMCVGAAVLFAAALFWPARARVGRRMTNMDQVAVVLNRDTRPGDLLIVNPWYLGPSLERYYRGQAEWVSVPPLEDHKLHRYDLVKQHMTRTDSMKPVIERVIECLKGGKRVWMVGKILAPLVGEKAPEVPVAANAGGDWREGRYLTIWNLQLGDVLCSHAASRRRLSAGDGELISEYENEPLRVLEGWREGDP
jgi:hypothetical protein